MILYGKGLTYQGLGKMPVQLKPNHRAGFLTPFTSVFFLSCTALIPTSAAGESLESSESSRFKIQVLLSWDLKVTQRSFHQPQIWASESCV